MTTQSLRRWAPAALAIVVASSCATGRAQMPGRPMPGGPMPGGPMPPGMRGPGPNPGMASPAGPYVNAHGEPIVVPATYGAPCGPGCPPGYYGPGGGGGYGGPGGYGDAFGGKSLNTEQCGPHYFDFSAEFLHLNRDAPLGEDRVLSTFGFANDDLSNVDDLAALRGGDVPGGDFDGFRLTGRLDVGALSVFEFSYSGLFTDESAVNVIPDFGGATPSAIDDNPLFSIFSRYGTATNGPVGVADSAGDPDGADQGTVAPGIFFEETDAAEIHSARFDSELHTAEASLRRYWVGFNPRVSGTLLVGFRYTELQELLEFRSRNFDITSSAPTDDLNDGDTLLNEIAINIEADNHLAGVQIGGDAWVSIVQGLRIGGEVKAGLYNNDHTVRAFSIASDGDPVLGSRRSNNQVAFLTEAKAMAVVNITPSLAIRGGYEVLFISDLALLEDNLLTNPPYGEASLYGAAAPGINAEGDVFYDGFNFGLEYTY